MKKTLLLLSILFITAFVNESKALSWAAMGTQLNGRVKCMMYYSGSLYAGGTFTAPSKGIARWNGSAWVAVGSGITGDSVNAMIVFGGNLYIGGKFTAAGGVGSTTNIAKWNGSAFSSASTVAFDDAVYCFTIFGADLVAGGQFTQPFSKIVKTTNGTAWTYLGIGNPPPGAPASMAVYNSALYVGGYWSIPNVSYLSGNSWVALTTTGASQGQVKALAVYGGKLYVGGNFASSHPNLLTYNGSAWAQASDPNGIVYSLCSAGGNLFVGGAFTALANPVVAAATHVASYNGTTWSAIGTGTNGDVYSVYLQPGGKLAAGGLFTQTDGATTVTNVAQTLSAFSTIGIEEPNSNIIVNNFYPNPMMKEAVLRVQTKAEIRQAEFKMYNCLGSEVNAHASLSNSNPMNNEVEFRIDGASLPAGIYFYRVADGSKVIASGRVIVE